jgi:hypothetical protein
LAGTERLQLDSAALHAQAQAMQAALDRDRQERREHEQARTSLSWWRRPFAP